MDCRAFFIVQNFYQFFNEVNSAYNDIMTSASEAGNLFLPETESTTESTSDTEAYSTTLTAGHYIVGVTFQKERMIFSVNRVLAIFFLTMAH